MKKLLIPLLLLWAAFTQAQSIDINLTQPNPVTFTLPADEAATSCGIYSPDGKTLLRTLWSNQPYKIGSHTVYWDGRDDSGALLTPGTTYTWKLTANNILFTWGVIGNSSTNLSGSTVHRGGTGIVDMVQIGSKFNCAQAFSEGSTSQFKFDTAAIQQKVEYKAQKQTFQASTFVVANGTYKFWAGKDYQGTHNFIFGENVSNDAIAAFSGGVTYTGPPPMSSYSSVLALNSLGNAGAITGMAIQQAGNGYLFVAEKNQNIIYVYKTAGGTGTLVQAIAITGPTNIAREDDTHLWIAQGTTVTRYTVNPDGTINPTATQITGLSRVAGLDIKGTNLLIADAGTQQVVKEYNTSTLSLVRTVGSVGGYASTPVVSNYRFYLEDLAGQYLTFVRFESDGTFWLGDTGNARTLHFSATGTYLNQIMYTPEYLPKTDGTVTPFSYNVNVCKGQGTAVFINFLEFTVDYSQPLSSGWILTNNYGYNYPAGWNQGSPVEAVALLSNSRRYMHVVQKGTTNNYLAELTTTGLRINTSYIGPAFSTMGADGYLTNFSSTGTSTPVLTYNRYPLTGFDGSNNPVYGTVTHSPAISLSSNYPLPLQRTYVTTTSNKLILFDNSLAPSRVGSIPIYHLAGYDLTTPALAWKTSPSTFLAYNGPFPTGAVFDKGNGVKYPGGTAVAAGNYILYNYHGENWGGGQTGIYYLFNDNGLMLAMGGFTGTQVSGVAPAGFFTNSQTSSATLQNSNLYLYFADESIHSAIHQIKTSNLSSIYNQTGTVTLSSRVFTSSPNKINLLLGTPDNQVSVAGAPGYSQFPLADVTIGTNQFYTRTRKNVYDLSLPPDVAITYAGTCTLDYLKKRLTTKTNLSQWTISGEFLLNYNTFKGSELSGLRNKLYVEVTDKNGKAIARIYFYTTNRVGFNGTFYGPYNGVKYGTSPFVLKRMGSNVYLSLNLWGTQLTTPVTGVPMYDTTADIANPVSISWNFVFPTTDYGYGSFCKLDFESK